MIGGVFKMMVLFKLTVSLEGSVLMVSFPLSHTFTGTLEFGVSLYSDGDPKCM